MTVLDAETLDRIASAVAEARETPVPLAVVMAGAVPPDLPSVTLDDRKPWHERPPALSVDLGGGYRANFSFEEQPAGLVRHLSLSLREGVAAPEKDVFDAVRAAFGMDDEALAGGARSWVEEFAPGRNAVHLVCRSPKPSASQ